MLNQEQIFEKANEMGISQTKLGQVLHRDKYYISNVKRGRSTFSATDVAILNNFLGQMAFVEHSSLDLTTATLLNEEVMLPVYGVIACGEPSLATQNIVGYIPFKAELVSTGEYFALKCKGNSMTPKINDGDTVVIKAQSDVDDGQIAAVLVNGDDATLKKIIHTSAGIMCIPFNANYEPKTYTESEIKILGRAIEVRAEL